MGKIAEFEVDFDYAYRASRNFYRFWLITLITVIFTLFLAYMLNLNGVLFGGCIFFVITIWNFVFAYMGLFDRESFVPSTLVIYFDYLTFKSASKDIKVLKSDLRAVRNSRGFVFLIKKGFSGNFVELPIHYFKKCDRKLIRKTLKNWIEPV